MTADAWFQAVQTLKYVVAEDGPLATLRRVCEITGWSHTLTAKRRAGGSFECEARLTDDDLELHAAKVAGQRAREVRHSAIKTLLSAALGRMVAHSAVAGLREGFQPDAVQGVSTLLDTWRERMLEAADLEHAADRLRILQ